MHINKKQIISAAVSILVSTLLVAGVVYAVTTISGTTITLSNGATIDNITDGRVYIGDAKLVLDPTLPADGSSHQTVEADANLTALFGSSTAGTPRFGGGVMGNVIGADLSKTKNYIGGLIGHYNITGTNASTYPVGAVLGGIGDTTTTADGAFVAYIDGDTGVTTAGAAFKVMNNNSTPGSGFSYGLDLSDEARDGYPAVSYGVADIRLQNGETISNETDGVIDFGDAYLSGTDGALNIYGKLVLSALMPEDAGSHQSVEADATLTAGFGSSTSTDPKFGAGVMGNLLSDENLTGTANYLGGVIGHYTLTGTVASTYQKGAVLGGIGGLSTTADGAFVAYIDGDTGVTTAEAAFKVMNNNSTPGSGFSYGLDLSDETRDGYPAVAYSAADIRLSSGAVILTGTVASNGGDCSAYSDGSIYLNTSDGNLYVCGGTTTGQWDDLTN